MPFIRHARDKRGYETTYVMHAYRPAHGPGRTAVLYFFRSPAHVKVGRRPLDEETREALQHTHPDLSFDWFSLGRESAPIREEREPRPSRRGREAQRQPPQRERSSPPPAAVQVIDESLLGRVLGAAEAVRLRKRYQVLVERIARRSRTPDERVQLSERAARLNPDDWPDEAAVRHGAATVEPEWEAIATSLPQRRRGRRGGRRTGPSAVVQGPDSALESGADDGGSESDSSEIIEEQGEVDAVPESREVGGTDSGPDAPRDGDHLGSATGTDGAAGDDVPRDN